MPGLGRIYQRVGVSQVRHPKDQLLQERANALAIDHAGRLTREAVAPHMPPLVMEWSPGDTGRKRSAQSGTAVLVAAFAETPPSSGRCLVTVSMYTELAGEETVGAVEIPTDQHAGVAPLRFPLPAGAWLRAVVTTANGASGVSTSVTIDTR